MKFLRREVQLIAFLLKEFPQSDNKTPKESPSLHLGRRYNGWLERHRF
jgi:hypothetical protein